MTDTVQDDDLYLLFLGSLIEELGAKMYPSVTASVAELISNAWDADAENVWITMPLGRRVESETDEIVVLDDGVGMSRDEAKMKYLIVGRKRRIEENSWKSPTGRSLHGRKGIGKLAAFGTAKNLRCITLKQGGSHTAFELDYDKIRRLKGGESYRVPELVEYTAPVRADTGEPLSSGTQVRLLNLLNKMIPNEERFRASIARRFGVLSPDMNIFLNGNKIERFDIPLDIRFPRDGVPEPGRGLPPSDSTTGEPTAPLVVDDGWTIENLPEGEVRWWIGFTATPIDVAELRGIAVLAHRKMVQRPFMFGRSLGTAGQLGQEYLVGEVVADWIDDNIQPEEDLVETNRSQLQLEDERLQGFLEWGRHRLRWALSLRSDLRRDKVIEAVLLDPAVERRLQQFTSREQTAFKTIGKRLSKMPEASSEDVTDLMMQIMDSYDDKSVREMIDRIGEEDETTQERMWSLIAEFGLIDARRTATKVQARMQVIEKLENLVESGALEVPDIHNHIRDNFWLLDPRWDLYGDEVQLTKMLQEKYGYQPQGQEHRADFLFAVGPSRPTPADEVIVVEIKRARKSDGSPRRVSSSELIKFTGYVGDASAYYSQGNSPDGVPTVRGLMVATGYAGEAELQRRELQEVPGGRYQFKSWESVLQDTKRLHQGWLELSARRGQASADAQKDSLDRL